MAAYRNGQILAPIGNRRTVGVGKAMLHEPLQQSPESLREHIGTNLNKPRSAAYAMRSIMF